MLIFFYAHFYYIIASIAQLILIFIKFPVESWDEEYVYCLTYFGTQMFFGGLFFYLLPWFFGYELLSLRMFALVFGLIFIISLLRVIKSIPFEMTFAKIIKQDIGQHVSFLSFYTQKRLGYLRTLDFETLEGEYRYNSFREKLVRIGKATSEKILDSEDIEDF